MMYWGSYVQISLAAFKDALYSAPFTQEPDLLEFWNTQEAAINIKVKESKRNKNS